MEKEIEIYFKENCNGEVSQPIVWDAYKAVLRGKIVSRSSSLKKLKQKDHKDRTKPEKVVTIKKLQNEIDKIYSEEMKKKLIFLKQGYYEAGSKAMKLLAYKLRKQQANNTVNKIRCP